MPTTPVQNQPLEIDCSSAVPPNLMGNVTVTLLNPQGMILGESTGLNGAQTVFTIDRANASDTGVYECRVTVTSPLLTSRGNSRPLEDTETLPVSFPSKPHPPLLIA